MTEEVTAYMNMAEMPRVNGYCGPVCTHGPSCNMGKVKQWENNRGQTNYRDDYQCVSDGNAR